MKRPEPKTFRYAEDDFGVATVELHRPERLNALTFESYRELTDTFAAIRGRDEVRAVLLCGAGRAFCSGGDARDIIQPLLRMSSEERLTFTRMTSELILNLRLAQQPIVVAVHGSTCGAGAVMALASDVRVMAQSAKIAFLFTRVGLSGADMGAAYLLPRVVGFAHATHLLLRGHFIDAYEARRIGLASEVVPDAELRAVAERLARELADGPQIGLRVTKEMLNREQSMDLAAALEAEARAQAMCMGHPDFAEANRAFFEKRAPDFRHSGGGPSLSGPPP